VRDSGGGNSVTLEGIARDFDEIRGARGLARAKEGRLACALERHGRTPPARRRYLPAARVVTGKSAPRALLRHARRLGLGVATLGGSLVLALVLALLLAGGTENRPDQGEVRFLAGSTPAFDRYTRSLNPAYGEFLRRHFWRMVVYSPYFDNKTTWYPHAWVYRDAYAIYRGSTLALEHPQWVLKDAAGRPLYIPFECTQGGCPQYAADIANTAYRRAWIKVVRAQLARGYRGLFIDDVNMQTRVSDGSGRLAAPIDEATGQPMTAEAWRRYMSAFMQEVRAALPSIEIAHNVEWLAGSPQRASDPLIAREIRAADYVNLERGVNDTGIRGGSGPFSLTSLLAYVDSVHALGRSVVLDGSASETAGIEYSLAAFLLISTGNDLVSAKGMTPDHWFSGFDLNLGKALGPRRAWMGLLRRDFGGGIALVAAPESAAHSVALPEPMRTLDGQTVRSVTLAPASGVVLLRR
jgi:hypothetical protein